MAKTLSDIADQLMEKKEPKEVLEIMLGGSTGKFIQSLHVPDWTLLYFKLQSRIPDQGWRMLLSISKLGQTGVGFDFEVHCIYCDQRIILVMHTYQSILAKSSSPVHLGSMGISNFYHFTGNLDLSNCK